jgi:hypothetical protein
MDLIRLTENAYRLRAGSNAGLLVSGARVLVVERWGFGAGKLHSSVWSASTPADAAAFPASHHSFS